MEKSVKKFFIFLGVVVGLFAVLIVVGLLNAPPRPPTASERAESFYAARKDPQTIAMKLVEQHGKMRSYAFANPSDATPPEKVLPQLRFFCDEMKSTVCIINVWKNEADAPKVYPMSQQEADAEYLSYTRNLNTGLEQLLVSDGKGMNEFPITAGGQ